MGFRVGHQLSNIGGEVKLYRIRRRKGTRACYGQCGRKISATAIYCLHCQNAKDAKKDGQ